MFNTAEDFWAYYQHMARPETMPENAHFYMFQDNIRPEWED
jgi:translation initiation factor 4E